MASGHGGARPGAGRKPNGYHAAASRQDNLRLLKAKADKEEQIAKIRAIEAKRKAVELQKEIGRLITARDFAEKLAEFVSIVTNWLETARDVLERDAGLDTDALDVVEKLLDELRDSLHGKLQDAFSKRH